MTQDTEEITLLDPLAQDQKILIDTNLLFLERAYHLMPLFLLACLGNLLMLAIVAACLVLLAERILV